MNAQPIVLDPMGSDIQGESAHIRASGPVTLVELPGGVRAWSVTDAGVLKRLLTDPRVSKDAAQHWTAYMNGEITGEWPLLPWVAVDNMFTAYGSDHRRLRKLVAPAFTHRRTTALRSRIEAITSGLLDQLAQTPAGTVVDLREAYCYPVPIQVISELMGVPEERNPALRTCVDGFFDGSLGPEEGMANYVEMYGLVTEIVQLKRETPGDDLISELIAARDEDDGSRLSEKELVDTLMLIINAGHETTVNLLDQAVFTLLTHPEHRAAVTEGRVSWTDLVEETLRFEAPVAHLPLRYAVEDIDIEGRLIPKGDPILASYAGANRDPKVHGPTADEFDPARTTKDQHLAFGHGVHHCLGSPLARLEATVALPALFTRFPTLTLAAAPATLKTVGSFISNGHAQLPVHLESP
ncbi:cytochrome P450 [Nocardia sp. NPDC006630]|uniref:cytochrome P450 family protein n=1 Tax=Nocardia sp. NPDC006630 TaxID=3157181 RepID=UPI0033B7F355